MDTDATEKQCATPLIMETKNGQVNKVSSGTMIPRGCGGEIEVESFIQAG